MAREKMIPANSTIASLPTIAGRKRAEYIRLVISNFYASGLDRSIAVVRIGTQGKGVAPHYKIEYPTTKNIPELDLESIAVQVTYRIYNGANHKEMTAFDASQVRPEHWSTKSMTFAEVSALLGEIRRAAR